MSSSTSLHCETTDTGISALRRSRRAADADFFVAPPPPIFGHRRAAAAAADFLVGAPPTQYIVSLNFQLDSVINI